MQCIITLSTLYVLQIRNNSVLWSVTQKTVDAFKTPKCLCEPQILCMAAQNDM